MRTSRLYSALDGALRILAAALAIVGKLQRLMSYTLARARASWRSVRRSVVESGIALDGAREGFIMTGIGIAAGVAWRHCRVAAAAGAALSGEPTDPLVLTGTAIGVALAALLGYFLPAMRASRVEPAVALRSE